MFVGPATGHINGIAGPIDVDPNLFGTNINWADSVVIGDDPTNPMPVPTPAPSIPRIAIYGLLLLGAFLIYKRFK